MSELRLHLSYFAARESAERHYLKEVDAMAEELRGRFITASAGQAMTYEAKHREADRYPQGSRFPFLEAEANALGITVQEVATSVIEARALWETLGSQIEAARLKAKKEIRLAETSGTMYEISRKAFSALMV